MDRVCDCGSRVTALLQELSCLRCGGRCCPSCAFALDSATYCVRCAESILEAEGVRLNLLLSSAPGGLGQQATENPEDPHDRRHPRPDIDRLNNPGEGTSPVTGSSGDAGAPA